MAINSNRLGGIDPAALAAATLAVAISAIAPPGPYSPIGSVIGLTVLVLILAYDVDPQRTRLQSVAFGAVCALVTVLVIGYVLEYVFATNRPKRLNVLKRELPQNEDLSYSEVPHTLC